MRLLIFVKHKFTNRIINIKVNKKNIFYEHAVSERKRLNELKILLFFICICIKSWWKRGNTIQGCWYCEKKKEFFMKIIIHTVVYQSSISENGNVCLQKGCRNELTIDFILIFGIWLHIELLIKTVGSKKSFLTICNFFL